MQQQLKQANIVAREMCTTLSFRAQVQVGHAGLSSLDGTLDDLVTENESRVTISCVAGTKQLTSVEHMATGAGKDAPLRGHEASHWKNRELFEIEAEDFGDLLASLKAKHSNLQSLTGGLADASDGSNIEHMVKKIFDAIDMDGSGVIDREELAAAIIRFDRNHDPEYLDRVLEEENIGEMEVPRSPAGA